MKKYWVFIVILVMIIASVGTFYIQSVFATNNLLRFTIEKISGDEKEIDSLVLTGYYYDELIYVGKDFEISLEGTNYSEDDSFFERIDYTSPQIKQLQKDHRNFMRGKYRGVNLYFQNEEVLAYADVLSKNQYTVSNEFEFRIAVLDKQTNKTTSFDHLVPNGGDFWYLNTIKNQVIDDQLKVVTVNDVKEDGRQELHLYTFDLNKKTLLNDEVILSTENEEDDYINISTLNVGNMMKEVESIAFVITSTQYSEGGFTEEKVREELVVYNIISNTSKVIDLQNLTEHGYPEYSDGSEIYFVDFSESEALKIGVYDIESEQIVRDFVVEYSNATLEKSRRFEDGKLYLVDSYIDFEDPALVTVVHLENGEILFEGEITPANQKDKVNKVELSIDNILIE